MIQGEDSKNIVEEMIIMTIQLTHQNGESTAGHGLPPQVIVLDDSLLVLIKAGPNNQERVDGTVTSDIGEKKRHKVTVTHRWDREKKINSL